VTLDQPTLNALAAGIVASVFASFAFVRIWVWAKGIIR